MGRLYEMVTGVRRSIGHVEQSERCRAKGRSRRQGLSSLLREQVIELFERLAGQGVVIGKSGQDVGVDLLSLERA